MDNFSWTDGVRAALSSCLPCLVSRTTTTTSNGNGIDSTSSSNAHQERSGHRQSQYDELEGLLADSGETTDTDAETVSLHSNLGAHQNGQRRRKRKKNGGRKVIRLFGWDLFGKPHIALEESDGEGEDSTRNRRRGRGRRTAPSLSLTSSLTMDSDARPLDPATIEQLSSPPPRTTLLPTFPSPHTSPSKHHQPVDGDTILEEEAQRLKEEREERKRERRALKRAAKAIALGIDDTEFEGFQGSGPGFPSPYTTRNSQAPSSPSTYTSPSGRGGGEEGQGNEFGPFVHGSQYQYQHHDHRNGHGGDEEGEDDAPDFGGEVYTRNARPTGGSTGSRSGSGSQSQSRGTSASNPPQYVYNHHYISQAHMVPLPPTPSSDGRLSPRVPNAPAPFVSDEALPTTDPFPPPKKTKKSSSSSSSKRSSKSRSSTSKNSKSNSSASTSQSQSIPSPVTSTFPEARVQVRLPPHQVQAPHPYALARSAREGAGIGMGNGDMEEGDGEAFAFDGSKHDASPAVEGGNGGGGGFPSTGFFGGAAAGMRRKNSDMGAFLARRGDD